MGLRAEEMELPALGRPAFLGQLYSAASERLLNSQLFSAEVLSRKQIVLNPSNGLKFNDIHTISDRAKALDITSDLSLSVLSGLIELKGSGQYLDINKSNVSSREVSMICSIRKCWERLERGVDDVITLRQYNRAVRQGASHVVTGITYGGTLVANVVEKESTLDSNHQFHLGFSASTLREMSAMFIAEGKVAVDRAKMSQDVSRTCDFDVYGDYCVFEQDNPTTIGDIFELAKKWPSLVRDGVPIQITVTPLDQLVDESIEAKILHELEADELATILTAYDDIYRLAARRAKVQAVLETGFSKLSACCPSFMETCRKRKNVTDGVLGRSRKALSRFLVGYRNKGDEGETTTDFLNNVREGLNVHLAECIQDESVLGLLGTIRELSIDCGAPLTALNELRILMTQADKRMLGVVLIHPSPNLDAVINTYKVLVPNIQRWRAEEDKKGVDEDGRVLKETVFVSFYCDATLVPEFLKLDGKRGALKRLLNDSAPGDDPRFVHYGILHTGLLQKQFDWCLVNEEGWAFLHNEKESYYYVGQVHSGKRHGRGTVTYANGATYTGDWWMDTRHGEGVLVQKSQRTTGVFIDDQYSTDGINVELTTFTHTVPIGSIKVPLCRRNSATAHIRAIGNMLEWADGREYKLTVRCAADESQTLEILVVGRLIKHGQDDMYNITWPFEKGIELWAEYS